MSGITRRNILAGTAGAIALPGLAHAQAAQQMAIATGTTGGVYYPLGGALANYLSRGIQGMSATVEVTGGSVANMQLLGANRVGMAITQVDAAVDAVRGNDRFRGRPVPAKAIAVLPPNTGSATSMTSPAARMSGSLV